MKAKWTQVQEKESNCKEIKVQRPKEASKEKHARKGRKQPGIQEMSCHTTFLLKKPVEHEKEENTQVTPILVVLHDIWS